MDAVLELSAPDGRRAQIAVEAKTRFEPREALIAGSIAGSLGGLPLIVVSTFLSEATRERLGELGLNWLDLSGNVRLALPDPALFIQTQGARRRPNDSRRGARSLKGQSAGRVVKALLVARPPIGSSDLAAQADVDPGYVSRILDLLVREALVEREPRGPVTEVDRYRLVRRWAEDAPLETRGRTGVYLEPRGISLLIQRLGSAPPTLGYAITGSLAAERWAPVAVTRLAQLYVRSTPSDAAQDLGLRSVEAGANVQLIEPRDGSILEAATLADDGLTYVTPLQAAVDLLSSPGRGPAEGEELLNWMLSQGEEVWRA